MPAKNDPAANQDPGTDPGTGDQGNAETEYWDRLDKQLDAWFDRRVEAERKNRPDNPGPGTSRTGGKRVTLPSIIAELVFGPPKDE